MRKLYFGLALAAVNVDASRTNGFVPSTVEAGAFHGTGLMDVHATVNTVTREVIELQGAAGVYYGFTSPAGVTPVTSPGLVVDEHGTAQGSMDIGRQFGDQNQFSLRVNAAGGRIGSSIDGVDDNVSDKRYWSAAGTRLAVGTPHTVRAGLKVDL